MKSKQISAHAAGGLAACVGLVPFVSIILFSSLAGCDMRFSSGGLRVAEYTDFHLTSHSTKRPDDAEDEKFGTLLTGEGAYEELASIYIELPDGERYLLKDIPESEVAKFYMKADLPPGLGECYRSGANRTSTFAFREGKLVYAHFTRSDSICVPFSPTKEGPYVKLPITRATMVELFGEPVKWGSYRPPSGP